MAKRLTTTELKALWLKGGVYCESGKLLTSFNDMCFEYNCGNSIEIRTGDEIIHIEAIMPKWMIWGALISAPTLLWALDSALKIAGF